MATGSDVGARAAPAQSVADLSYVHMFAGGTGWALGGGGAVFRTTDGGARWTDVTPPSGGAPCGEFGPGSGVFLGNPWGVDFLNAQDDWVVCNTHGRLVLFGTHTAGRSWRESTVPASGAAAFTFASPEEGYWLVVGPAEMGTTETTLYRSLDGGGSWRKVSSTTYGRSIPGTLPLAGDKTGVAYAGADTLFVTCAAIQPACFWISRNGGRSWARLRLPVPYPRSMNGQDDTSFYPPVFSNALDGVMPVVPGDGGLAFYRTADGGAHWTASSEVPHGKAPDAYSASFPDAEHGFVAVSSPTGKSWIVHTRDGGAAWTNLPAAGPLAALLRLRVNGLQIDFTSERDAWVLVEPRNGPSRLLRTTDGGKSWRLLAPTIV